MVLDCLRGTAAPKRKKNERKSIHEEKKCSLEGAKARRGRKNLKQIQAGPQEPRWLMKVRKGFLEVDPPPHQPKKKKLRTNREEYTVIFYYSQ